MKRLFLFLVLAGMLIGGATAAQTVDLLDVTSFDYDAIEGYSIYQVSVNNLINGETSVTLDSYDDIYLIDIVCTHTAYSPWVFNVTITYPDSSEYSEEVTSYSVLAPDYDLKIQYIDGELDNLLDVDLFVYSTPTVTLTIPSGWDTLLETETIHYFSSVSGTMPNAADVRIYFGTYEDIKDIEDGDILAQLIRTMQNVGSDIFSWSWDAITYFVLMIPYVGEYFVAILEITGSIIIELLWYFNFFVIQEPEITFCLAECFILGHAIISGRSFIRMLQLVYTDHVKLINGLVAVVEVMFNLIMRVVDIVTSIINAMKPV